jgi:uncharacterized membrane protein
MASPRENSYSVKSSQSKASENVEAVQQTDAPLSQSDNNDLATAASPSETIHDLKMQLKSSRQQNRQMHQTAKSHRRE